MRTIHLIVALCAVALLGACGTPAPRGAQQLVGIAGAQGGTIALLATNECEAALAPVQVRAIVGVREGTAAFKAGRIDGQAFDSVIASGYEAQRATRAACPNKRLNEAELGKAKAAVDRIATILGGR